MQKVFDTSAFLNRFFFNDIDNVITTNSVLNEIKNIEQKQQIENLIQNRKISIQDPSKQIYIQIKKKAPKQLSKTDIEVIALAKELDLELHTDDFMMRKFCNGLKIKVKPVAYALQTKDENILDTVYNKIKPTKEELLLIDKVSKKIIVNLNKIAKKEKIHIKKILLAGSSARGTFITNKKDLDIFILFDLSLDVDEIKKYNELLLAKTFPKTKFREEYGEHPYLKAVIENHNIDFVPGYYITNIKDRKSSVDRTPLHLKFLNKYQNEEIKKQVILLKQFLKNNLLYGADQKNNGFSGYLTELLILKWGKFENVLKELLDYNKNKYIYINKSNTIKNFDDYFVFIDPTDESRNVASAVSKKTYTTFQYLANNYLKDKSIDYFFKDCFPETNKNLICFELNINGKTDDSKWGIIKGTAKRLANELNTKHYNVINYSGLIVNDNGIIILESILKDTLRGPELKDLKNSKAFKSKHKNTYIKDNRLYCDIILKKENLINDSKKIVNKLLSKIIKLIEYSNLKLNNEEIKRIKKDFLKI